MLIVYLYLVVVVDVVTIVQVFTDDTIIVDDLQIDRQQWTYKLLLYTSRAENAW